MFHGLFGWLRQSVRAAVIGGVQDAISDLTTAEMDAPPVVALRLSCTPAAVDEGKGEPTKSRRKAE